MNSVFPMTEAASGQGGDNPTLHARSYTYPFRYQLQNGLPSSFEGSVGRIRYYLNATIDKPWKFDHTTKRAFTVVNLLDLNSEPGAADGSRGGNEKTPCCLCCKSGPISGKFQIDRCGNVPRESIPIKAEVINHSNRRMKRSYAELFMVRPQSSSTGFSPPLQGPSHSQLYQGGTQASAPPEASMPPPTYADSAFGTVNIKAEDDSEYTKGDMNYTPVYAYYNWETTAQPTAPTQ